jgi:xanthine dehydrogenase/oxidase
LLRNAANEHAVFSSKAVGEPPLFLGAATFYAIKDAIGAARIEHGADASDANVFRLDSPATAERIRVACEDKISRTFPPLEGARWNTLA